MIRRLLTALLALRFLRGRRRPPPEPDPTTKEIPASGRGETAAAAFLLLAGLCGAGFVVVYLADGSNELYGLTLGLGFVFLAAAFGTAGKRVVPQETQVEPVHLHPEEPADEDAAEERLESAAEGVTRRRAIAGAAGAAGLGLGAALVVPVASLGPNVGNTIENTPWRRGRRLVDESGKPIAAADLVVGDFVTAFPEGITGSRRERMDVPVILLRLRPDEVHMPPDRTSWTPEGLIAYSQICTHAGCAVSMLRYPLNEQTSHAPGLVCPCHYSTFDPRRAGRVTFGPAGRPLPQLPLELDAQRNVAAAGGLSAPPGPSWPGAPHRRL